MQPDTFIVLAWAVATLAGCAIAYICELKGKIKKLESVISNNILIADNKTFKRIIGGRIPTNTVLN